MEAKNAFERFKPAAANVAEEMRWDLGKRIAEKKGTDPKAEFKKLSRQVWQGETGMKIRRVNKKLKKGFVCKFIMTDPATGAVTAVEDKVGMKVIGEATDTE